MSLTEDTMKIVLLQPSTVTDSQISELTTLIPEAFTGFNKSLGPNVHPDMYEEEFGNPNLAGRIVESIAKSHDGFAAVDEKTGKIVGVTFVDISAKGSKVASMGPVASAAPGAGRLTFDAACKHAEKLGFTILVLEQVAANTRSFPLYAKYGFQGKHVCHYFGGFISSGTSEGAGCTISELTEDDVDECAALFLTAHGEDRGWDRRQSIAESLHDGMPFPKLVARGADGKLLGYSTGFYLAGHQVVQSEGVFKALFRESSRIQQEKGLPTPKFHNYMENPSLVSWALAEKLTLLRATVFMAKGPYEYAWPDNGYIVCPSTAGW